MNYDPTLMKGRGANEEQNREWLKGYLLMPSHAGTEEIPFEYSQVQNRRYQEMSSSFAMQAIVISEVIYTSRIDLAFRGLGESRIRMQDGNIVMVNAVEPNRNEYGKHIGYWIYLGVAG